MICRDCLAWFSLNQHTDMGLCMNPNYCERGVFTRMRTTGRTRCRFGLKAKPVWRRLNKPESSPRCTR